MPIDLPPPPPDPSVTIASEAFNGAELETLHLQTAQLLGQNLAAVQIQGPVSPGLLAMLNRSNPALAKLLPGQNDNGRVQIISNPELSEADKLQLSTKLYGEFVSQLHNHGLIESTPEVYVREGQSPNAEQVHNQSTQAPHINFSLNLPEFLQGYVEIPNSTDKAFLTWGALAHEAAHTEQAQMKAPFHLNSFTATQNSAMNEMLFTPHAMSFALSSQQHFNEAFADAYGQLMLFKLMGKNAQNQASLQKEFNVYKEMRENSWYVNEKVQSVEAHDHQVLELMGEQMKDSQFWTWVSQASPSELKSKASEWASQDWVHWLQNKEVQKAGLGVEAWGGAAFPDQTLGYVLNRIPAYTAHAEKGIPLSAPQNNSPLTLFLSKSDQHFEKTYMEIPASEREAYLKTGNISALPHVLSWMEQTNQWIANNVPNEVFVQNSAYTDANLKLVKEALSESFPASPVLDLSKAQIAKRLSAQREEALKMKDSATLAEINKALSP